MENIIIGRNPVLEAIKSGREIDKIIVKKGEYEGSIVALIKKAKSLKIPVVEADKAKLESLANGGNHQGVIAFVAAHTYKDIKDMIREAKEKSKEPLIIILDKITDPHNFGSILRTANCAGADGVVISKRGNVGLSEVVAKTSAGAIEFTPVSKVTNIAETIELLKKEGFWIVGAEADGQSMYETDLTGPVALVIGSEGEGISRLVKEKCDFLVKINMYGEINSLNASVAAGIMMYEIVRQKENVK
ncbi:MAG: 23S rRNA (guanosine(2251)-2'-O)-methyltransferase RlmB [Clostridia bacterium]|nr:23S rRNA (guanosine(2251)-2'-O)-methyltransferase RlmB [Clostridia bacterium]